MSEKDKPKELSSTEKRIRENIRKLSQDAKKTHDEAFGKGGIGGTVNTPVKTTVNTTALNNYSGINTVNTPVNTPQIPQEGIGSIFSHPLYKNSVPRPKGGKPKYSGEKQRIVLKMIAKAVSRGITMNKLKEAYKGDTGNVYRVLNQLEKDHYISKKFDSTGIVIIRPNQSLIEIVEEMEARESGTVFTTVNTTVDTTVLDSSKNIDIEKIKTIFNDPIIQTLVDYAQQPEEFSQSFPYLNKIGFEAKQLEDCITRHLKKYPEKPRFSLFPKSLRMMDYEASRVINEGFKPQHKKKNGQLEDIESLPGYYCKGLIDWGEVRKPEGYVDPEIKQAEDQARLLKEIEEKRKAVIESGLQQFKDRLSEEEKKKLISKLRNEQSDIYNEFMNEDRTMENFFKSNLEMILNVMNSDMFKALPDDFFE